MRIASLTILSLQLLGVNFYFRLFNRALGHSLNLSPLGWFVLYTCVFNTQHSMATMLSVSTYSDYDLGLGFVVRGEIKNIKQVSYNENNKEVVCGSELQVSVKKSWKGEKKEYTIFVSKYNQYLTVGMEYIILAYKNKYFNNKELMEDYFLCDNKTKISLNSYEYFLDGRYQFIFPIDAQASVDWNESMMIYLEPNPEPNPRIFMQEEIIKTKWKEDKFGNMVTFIKVSDFIESLFTIPNFK